MYDASRQRCLLTDHTVSSLLTGSWSVIKSDVFLLTRSQSLEKNDEVKPEVEQ